MAFQAGEQSYGAGFRYDSGQKVFDADVDLSGPFLA